MDIRYRWYRIHYPDKNFIFSSLIENNPFTGSSRVGFTSLNDEFGNPKYRFLKRSEVTITVLDEDGDPSYQQVSTVDITDFSIFSVESLVFLRIENPGRSIRELLNTLEKNIGLGFTCKAVTFEKVSPTKILTSIDNTNLIGLKVSGVVSKSGLKANLELVSNDGISIDKVNLLKDMRYSITSAVIEVVYEGRRGKASLASTGLVKVSGNITPKITYAIESILPKLV